MKALENLSLGELFRHFFCGCVFVCVFHHSREDHVLPLGDPPGVVFVAALVVGSIIYAVHRALVYPALGRIAVWFALGWPKPKGWRYFNTLKPLPWEMSRDKARWERRQDKNSAQCHLDKWADQIHLLYCVAWASVLASAIATKPFYGSGKSEVSWLVVSSAIISVGAAFAGDYRLSLFETRLTAADAVKKATVDTDATAS